MQHLYLFYFFLTVSIGIVSLAITVNAYIKTREKLLQYYLYFYSAFTLEVVCTALVLYISTNIPTLHPDVLMLIAYVATVAHYLLMFAIPVFTHVLWPVPHSRIKNILFGGLAILLYIGHHFFVFVTKNESLQRLGEYIEAGMFLSVILYAFVVGLSHYKALQEPIRKAIALRVLILLGVFLPGILYETLPNANSSMIFSPFLYCGFSMLFTYYLVTQYPSSPQTSENMTELGAMAMSEEEFFETYHISPREREVASLLLQGYTNHRIADTLCIAVNTVKTHIRNMYPKFGVTSRYELLVLFKNSERSSTAETEHHNSAT